MSATVNATQYSPVNNTSINYGVGSIYGTGNPCYGISDGHVLWNYGTTDAAAAKISQTPGLVSASVTNIFIGSNNTLVPYRVSNASCASGPNAGPNKKFYDQIGTTTYSGYKIGVPLTGAPSAPTATPPGFRQVPQPAFLNRISKPMAPAMIALAFKRTVPVVAAIAAGAELARVLASMLGDFVPPPATQPKDPPVGVKVVMLSSEQEKIVPSAPTPPPKQSPTNIIFTDNSTIMNSSLEIFNFPWGSSEPDQLTDPAKEWLKTLAGALTGLAGLVGGSLLDNIIDGLGDIMDSAFTSAIDAAGQVLADILGQVLADLIDPGLDPGDDGAFDYADPPDGGIDYSQLQDAIYAGVSDALATMPTPPPSEVVLSSDTITVLDGYFKTTTGFPLADVLTFPFVLPDQDPAW